jgi:hypothetical protein
MFRYCGKSSFTRGSEGGKNSRYWCSLPPLEPERNPAFGFRQSDGNSRYYRSCTVGLCAITKGNWECNGLQKIGPRQYFAPQSLRRCFSRETFTRSHCKYSALLQFAATNKYLPLSVTSWTRDFLVLCGYASGCSVAAISHNPIAFRFVKIG